MQSKLSTFFKKTPQPQTPENEEITPSTSSASVSSEDHRPNKKIKKESVQKVTESTLLKWKSLFPWLIYDAENQLLKCSVCMRYVETQKGIGVFHSSFISGTKTFKKETLDRHDKSATHLTACKRHRVHSVPQSSDLAKSILHLDKVVEEKMTLLFNTAYLVAKQDYSFLDFKQLCLLQKKNGLLIGDTYLNDKSCRDFIQYISKSMEIELKHTIKNADFISIMADGSTDRSCKEAEIVYLTSVTNGKVSTNYMTLQELSDGRSVTIFTAIQNSLELFSEDWKDKLVACCFDGAAVNLGEYNSVSQKFKAVCDNIISVHCIAHRLELAVGGGVKNNNSVNQLETILKGIYKIYNNSPKLKKGLEEVGKIFDEKILKNTSILDIRWVASKERAIKALINNYVPTVHHLENFCTDPQSDKVMVAKVKGILRQMKSVKFVKFLHFFKDVISTLTDLSKVFQRSEINLERMKSDLDLCVQTITDFKNGVYGSQFQRFIQDYNEDTLNFKGIVLTDDESNTFETNKIQVTSNLLNHLNKRFKDIYESQIFKHVRIFDPLNLPEDLNEVNNYGDSELTNIYDALPNCVKNKINAEQLKKEFKQWKMWAFHKKSVNLQILWDRLYSESESENEAENPGSFKNLLYIQSFLRCLPFSTSVCERGFSAFNLIKTDNRNCLLIDTVHHLLNVHINGPSLEHFCAKNAIKLWWDDANRVRRIEFKRH